MSVPEKVAYSALSGSPEITAIVGPRIYPDVVPERVPLPAIVISRMTTDYVNTIHGGVPPASLVHLEIWCMDDSRADAEALADIAANVITGAEFFLEDRRPEFDPEIAPPIWSSVVTIAYWQIPT